MDEEAREQLKHVHGRSFDPVTDEGAHFYVCLTCGQAVDMRSLYQVFHHEEEGHKPLSEAEWPKRVRRLERQRKCARCLAARWEALCPNL
jgi:hypothetical protein